MCVCVCVCVCVLVAQLCLTLRLHGLYPTRILCLWDSPGKNTGVGCHFLLQGSSKTRDRAHISCLGRRILYRRATGEAPCIFTLSQSAFQVEGLSGFIFKKGSPVHSETLTHVSGDLRSDLLGVRVHPSSFSPSWVDRLP